MKRFLFLTIKNKEYLTILGAALLLIGAIMKMSYSNEASYIYISGATLFAIMQFIGRTHSNKFAIRRLVTMQIIGALALVTAGVLMFTHDRNEWIVAMTIGSLLELYTSFRIPHEMKK